MTDYDVIIIGSGVAGLTAALFAARHGLSTLVLEANIPGGHLVSIEKIEDFPGFPAGIAGYELCPSIQRQAAEHGAQFQRAEVTGVAPQDRLWAAITRDNSYRAKAVIAATGSSLKRLGVPGAARLMGRGLSHCASCDGPLYHNRTVGVVGGGDSALQEALALANYAERVLVFHEGSDFSAQQSYQERVLNEPKIIPRYRTVVKEVLGGDAVSGVRVHDLAMNDSTRIDLAALFVYIGLRPNTDFLATVVKLTESGHVPTDSSMKTECDGLYAAGDIRENSAAQAIASAGDGATAAIAARRYIRDNFGANQYAGGQKVFRT